MQGTWDNKATWPWDRWSVCQSHLFSNTEIMDMIHWLWLDDLLPFWRNECSIICDVKSSVILVAIRSYKYWWCHCWLSVTTVIFEWNIVTRNWHDQPIYRLSLSLTTVRVKFKKFAISVPVHLTRGWSHHFSDADHWRCSNDRKKLKKHSSCWQRGRVRVRVRVRVALVNEAKENLKRRIVLFSEKSLCKADKLFTWTEVDCSITVLSYRHPSKVYVKSCDRIDA